MLDPLTTFLLSGFIVALIPAAAAPPGDAIACAMTRPAPEINVLINDEHHGRFELRFIDGPVRIRRDCLAELSIQHAEDAASNAVTIERLSIGSEVFERVPAVPWDPPEMYAADDAPDGLLTLDVFNGRLVTLDVANGTLHIERGSLADVDDAITYEVRDDDGGRGLFFTARIGGAPLELALSANAQTTIHFNDAAAADLPLKGEPGIIGRVITENGESDISGARLARPLVAGALMLESAGVRFSDLFDAPVLGIGGLDEHVITFDPARKRVRFAKAALRTVDAPPGTITPIDDSLGNVRAAFNRDKEKVRLVMILSPT